MHHDLDSYSVRRRDRERQRMKVEINEGRELNDAGRRVWGMRALYDRVYNWEEVVNKCSSLCCILRICIVVEYSKNVLCTSLMGFLGILWKRKHQYVLYQTTVYVNKKVHIYILKESITHVKTLWRTVHNAIYYTCISKRRTSSEHTTAFQSDK